jgi:peptidoglycan/LPS O-acetylase OafA/YrhL
MNLMNLAKKQWDRSAAIVFTVIGAIALIGGWVGVRGTPVLAEQTRYIVSGGIGAVFLLGVGATLWLSADLRDEWRKLDRIEQSLGDGVLRWAGNGSTETGATATTVDLTLAIPPGHVPTATTARSNA